ncbi:MAG: hypothetical protein IPL74_13575 [Bacteroidetes bacterium]|nr:hypothetical protein [Bacteroidota bacterium]
MKIIDTVCVALQVTGTGIDDIFISNEQVDVTSINAGGTINVDCNQITMEQAVQLFILM